MGNVAVNLEARIFQTHIYRLISWVFPMTLHWHHNDHDGVSNRQPRGCLLNRLFKRRSKKASKLRVTGLCAGNSPGPVNSPHKGPVTRKMFSFDDVIMKLLAIECPKNPINDQLTMQWLVNIGLGNRLMPYGKKPKREIILTQMYVAIRRH